MRYLPTIGLALLAAIFAWINRAETAALHLGFATFYRTPVAVLALGAFLLGMVAMFLLGLRQDRQLRRELRAREWRMGGPLPEPTAPDATLIPPPPR
ncbi:MAG: LapA family protein [Gemmatimonadota bacterium]|nr:LapA family protein [Gemmatimonadota bacterium]